MNTAYNNSSSVIEFDVAINKDAIPGFGVAIFDMEWDMSEGWACRAGQGPFRFSSVSDLTNDTIWITSLNFKEFNFRATTITNLRRTTYMGSSLVAIAADLGISIRDDAARESSVILANVFKQMMMIAVHSYNWDSPVSDFRNDIFAKDIARIIPKPTKPTADKRVALMSAYQAFSCPAWDYEFEPNPLFVNIKYNRLEYAQMIMATRVPDDNWTYFPIEKAGRLSIDDLLNPACPSLVEATINLDDISPDISTLISFGAQPKSKKTILRKWISQPELAWISRHAEINVTSAFISKSSKELPPMAALPARLTADPFFSLSISAGLLAESHWHAIVERQFNQSTRSEDASSWAVWLRAMDRFLSFKLAKQAMDAGFVVSNYGNGAATIRIGPGDLEKLLNFSTDNGISHPNFRKIYKDCGVDFE